MEPFVGEIRMFTGNFAPAGWALCNGQLLAISQNTALFSLLGTFYGGNGIQTFGLPNLQGAFAVGQGQGPGLSARELGETGGVSSVSLTTAQIPPHKHLINAGSPASTGVASSSVVPASSGSAVFHGPTDLQAMSANELAVGGGGAAHENRQPFLVVNFIIALQGVFPARS